MTVLRFLAGLLLIAAVIALVTDVSRPLTGAGPFAAMSFGQLWNDTAPRNFATVRTAVSQAASPAIWNALAASLLKVPAFLLFGALGVLLGWLGRRRRRINVYTN